MLDINRIQHARSITGRLGATRCFNGFSCLCLPSSSLSISAARKKVHPSLHWVMIILMTKSDNLFQLESHLQACSHCWAFTPRTTISERKGLLQDAGYSDKIQLIHLCAKLTIFLLPLSSRSLHKNLSLSTVRHLFSPFRKNISLIQETGLIKLVAPVMILLYLV